MAAVCNLSEEQLKRVLNALSGDCIEWKPDFSGRRIELVDPELVTPELDRDLLQEKLDYELGRLEEVISYCRHSRSCRQQALIAYFGETGKWRCGKCDICQLEKKAQPLSDAERHLVHTLLSGAACFDGKIGAGLLSKVLAGSEQVENFRRRSPAFGVLKGYRQNYLLSVIQCCEQSGLLERTDLNGYPCLQLTEAGRQGIFAPEDLALNMPLPESASSTPKRTKTVQAQVRQDSGGLLELLTSLRNKIAEAEKVPRYMILSNAVLEELARLKPRSVAQACQINGVGPGKSKTIIPAMLEAIKMWQERQK